MTSIISYGTSVVVICPKLLGLILFTKMGFNIVRYGHEVMTLCPEVGSEVVIGVQDAPITDPTSMPDLSEHCIVPVFLLVLFASLAVDPF